MATQQAFACDMHRETVPGGVLNATVTPLASIFGSGFLVIAPILTAAVGPYAVFAMIGICALAYGVGMVMRHNSRDPQWLHLPAAGGGSGKGYGVRCALPRTGARQD